MRKKFLKIGLAAVFVTGGIYVLFNLTSILTGMGGVLAVEDMTAVSVGIQAFQEGEYALHEGDVIRAAAFFKMVPAENEFYYHEAMKQLAMIEKEIYHEGEASIREYLSRYEIEKAENFLTEIEGLLPEDGYQKLSDMVASYSGLYEELELYKGPIEHVFTHCLIAFPEICYTSPSMMQALDTDCITPYEFNKILTALYEKDYILIDINDIYQEGEDGSIVQANLYLPKGKKPLVFSIDDVTYDSRKMSTGMVDKLIVDENGRIATYTLHTDGEEVISYENEVFPILEAFVRQHPDFSFKGARGTLCLTGFEGVFGYRIQQDSPNREQELENVTVIVDALKTEGWTFASHSYGHGQMDKMSFEKVQDDTQKWAEQVASVIGETKIFVWPYGAAIRSGVEYDYLYQAGFRLFCGVGSDPYLVAGNGKIFMDRKALDGYALRNRQERYLYLFDTEAVIDPIRPK